MKSSELHRLVKRNGWKHIRTEGSHYIYEKNSITFSVPNHETKETPKGLEIALRKGLNLK